MLKLQKSMQALCMAALALATFSCSQDELVKEPLTKGNATITASFEGNSGSTRTSVSDQYQVLWSTTDAFGLFYSEANTTQSKFSYASGAGTTSATFTGGKTTDKTPSCAIFPYQDDMTVSNNTLTMKLPDAFNYITDSNGPMYAKVTDAANLNQLSFKHLAALIKLTVNKIPTEATTFKITASNDIAGTCTADLSAGEPVLVVSSEGAKKTITVTFAASSGTTSRSFYIPLPIGTYASITAELTNGSDKTYFTKTLTNRTLKRKSLLEVPALDCVTIDATTPSEISDALSSSIPTGDGTTPVNTDVALTGEVDATSGGEAIEIPVAANSNVNLAFTTVPKTSAENPLMLEEKDLSGSSEPATAVNKISVAIPQTSGESGQTEAPSVSITMPKTTVTLGSVGETATYNKVIAKTATNTLIVKAGVTIKELVIAGGNVEIYGTVEKLTLADENTATTTVVSGEAADIKVVTDSNNKFTFTSTWDGISKIIPTGNKIYTAAQLAYFQSKDIPAYTTGSNLTATMKATTTLCADIDLANQPWIGMVLDASITFDGGNHTISKLMIKEYALSETSIYTPAACVGLFASTKLDSQIKNVTVKDFTVEGKAADAKWSGALVGYSYGTSSYDNCHAENVKIESESADAYRIGGLIGFIAKVSSNDVAVTLKDCSATNVTIKGSFAIAGLVGTIQGATNKTFTNCDVANIRLSMNEESCVNTGAFSNTTFYGPKSWVGYMSKFIGDINATGSTISIDSQCSVDAAFTTAELTAFGYDNFADYTYLNTATEEEKAAIVNGANYYSLKDATSHFVPAQVDNGTVVVNSTTLKAGTDYNLFTLIKSGSSNAEGYDKEDGTWAN